MRTEPNQHKEMTPPSTQNLKTLGVSGDLSRTRKNSRMWFLRILQWLYLATIRSSNWSNKIFLL